jgi:uncharacterized membrane protein YqjE
MIVFYLCKVFSVIEISSGEEYSNQHCRCFSYLIMMVMVMMMRGIMMVKMMMMIMMVMFNTIKLQQGSGLQRLLSICRAETHRPS